MTSLEQVRRKPIAVDLGDGVEREIKFTLNTMADLEEKYGTIDAAFEELEKGSIKSIRFFLWAALQHEDKPLTEKQVGAIIDVQSLGKLMKAIEEATKQDMPQEEDKASIATDPN